MTVNIEHLRRIAKQGGLARVKKYGNPGTATGRKKGGLQSVKTHRSLPNSPFVAKKIQIPKKSPELAELFGIVLGDGGLTEFQLVVYIELAQEKKYAGYIAYLFKKLFNAPVSVTSLPSRGVLRIICARKGVVNFLLKNGLSCGSKVRRQADVPEWIRKNLRFRKACLRGLIDTDGSVYADSHRVKERIYTYPCISFSNASEPLLYFVSETLSLLGYHPTKGLRQVFLRKSEETKSYMKKIGTRNPKHSRRFHV